MIYLIGGPSRSYKTRIRKSLLENFKITGLDTDTIRTFLELSFPNIYISHSNPPLVNIENGYSYIKNFIIARNYFKDDFVLEGDMIHPRLVIDPDLKNIDFKMIFFGYSNFQKDSFFKNIRNIETNIDWTRNLSDDMLMNKLEEFIVFSKFLEKKCLLHKVPFFDISDTRIGYKEIYSFAIEVLDIEKNKKARSDRA